MDFAHAYTYLQTSLKKNIPWFSDTKMSLMSVHAVHAAVVWKCEDRASCFTFLVSNSSRNMKADQGCL